MSLFGYESIGELVRAPWDRLQERRQYSRQVGVAVEALRTASDDSELESILTSQVIDSFPYCRRKDNFRERVMNTYFAEALRFLRKKDPSRASESAEHAQGIASVQLPVLTTSTNEYEPIDASKQHAKVAKAAYELALSYFHQGDPAVLGTDLTDAAIAVQLAEVSLRYVTNPTLANRIRSEKTLFLLRAAYDSAIVAADLSYIDSSRGCRDFARRLADRNMLTMEAEERVLVSSCYSAAIALIRDLRTTRDQLALDLVGYAHETAEKYDLNTLSRDGAIIEAIQETPMPMLSTATLSAGMTDYLKGSIERVGQKLVSLMQ